MIHILALAIGTYLLLMIAPRSNVHTIVTAYVFIYLSSQHIYRMVTDFGGWKMDTTSFTML